MKTMQGHTILNAAYQQNIDKWHQYVCRISVVIITTAIFAECGSFLEHI